MNVAGFQPASHNSFSSQYSAVSPSSSCLTVSLFSTVLISTLLLFSVPPPSSCLSVSLSLSPPLIFPYTVSSFSRSVSLSLSPLTLPFCFLCHIYEELTPYLFSAAGCLTWKNFKSFESRVGGNATETGTKKRLHVSWTEKFLHFPVKLGREMEIVWKNDSTSSQSPCYLHRLFRKAWTHAESLWACAN